MSITVPGTSTALGTGPLFTGQILAFGPTDYQEYVYKGTIQVTLDGAATSAVIPFIDGTNALPFTPSAVLVGVVGGTQPAAAFLGVSSDTVTTTGFTVRLSAAGTNTNTLKIAWVAFK